VRTLTVATLLVLVLVSRPASARADWFVSPFVGATLKGDATHTSTTAGVSGGWMGTGWLGFEADLGWSPDFLKKNGFLTNRAVTSMFGNVMVNVPYGAKGPVTPYVSAGLGALRVDFAEAGGLAVVDDTHKLGGDLGVGAMGFFNRNLGVRGDVRYFRAMRKTDTDDNPFGIDVSKLHFWRLSVGMVARF